jgi:hypothetical protein
MAYPTPIVEIAFTDGPYVLSPTWTDVTDDVRGMEINRGFDDDWNLVATGSASVILSNLNRDYDPFNTAGPYYGNLLPRRQIRIRATHGGTTYDVFRGYVDGWPATWTDAGFDSTVTLSCFDALDLLASAPMPPVWSSRYINDLGAEHFWKLDDPIVGGGTIVNFTDSGTRATPIASSNIIYQTQSLASGIPDTCAGSANNLTAGATVVLPVPWGAYGNFSFATWTRNNQVSANGSVVVLATNGLSFEMAQITAVGAQIGQYRFRIRTTTLGYEWFSTAKSLTEPHHVVFTYNSSTGQGLVYIDGLPEAPTRNSFTTLFGPFTFEQIALVTGEYQHVATFNKTLTPTEASTIYQYSLNQLSETSSQRETRIIGYTPFSTSLTNFAGSETVLDLPANLANATLQLKTAALSEYGPLFVNKTGVVTSYSRNQIRTQTKSIVSQAQYGNGVGFVGNTIGTEVQLQYAGDDMRNIADVSCTTAGTVTVTNTASVNTYGSAEASVSTVLGTLASATNVGQIVSGWGGQVFPTASPTEVVLSPSASWASTLALELYDRFTLQVTPPTGSSIVNEMLTLRISHAVTPDRWTTTLEGTARWASVFILDKSKLDGLELLG